MDLSDFDQLFGALTGREPYPWQKRLYRRFMAGGAAAVPDALDLPTGLGKTSVMAIWLAARINGADLPRRLIYAVDRRAVVDQATTEAVGLAEALDRLIDGEHGTHIRERLGLSHKPKGVEGEPGWLPISTLRGQFLDNRRWLEDPASAAIVVGTVDMIGSRLLFSGYGVSRWMRPVHAGLIGVDSLVVLDESHLVPPFEAMLRSAAGLIGQDVQGSDAPDALKPLRVMSLSATGTERENAEVFRLEDEDRDDPRTAVRLNAAKRVRLEAPVAASKAVETLANLAWAMRTDEDGTFARRVVVFCNSRETAQKVEKDLATRVAKAKDAYGKDAKLTALLVGERRFAERQKLTDDPVFQRFMAGAPQGEEDRPAFLVATSAGEVGVDLDADDLVCDLVAWERMVQRLGRVNRRADPGVARLLVVPVAGDKEAEDPIDDPRLQVLLAPFACGEWVQDAQGAFDGSPEGLRALKAKAGAILDAASTPEPLRPPLTRPVVEAWSLTSLESHTGRPKVQPWLRGWVETEPQTRVVWRRWLPLRDKAEVTRDLSDYLEESAPPHVSEALEAPSWRVAEMLRDRAKALLKAKTHGASEAPAEDAAEARPEAAGEAEATAGPRPMHPVVVVRLSAEGAVDHIYTLEALDSEKADRLTRDIAYGTVVVDARLGGLDRTGLLGKEAEAPATADSAGWSLAPETTTGWKVTAGERPALKRREADGRWSLDEFRWSSGEADTSWALWVELWRGVGRNPGDPAIASAVQGLQAHLTETGAEAARIADALGLDPGHRAVLVAAAQAHDLGKARDLWQNAMGAPTGAERPYAKTRGGGSGRALNGYRHEFGSLREVLEAPDLYLAAHGVTDPDLADLALHLIAAHHGRSRPTVNAYDPEQPITLSPPLARDAALRFARLQAQWGPWGLAWWEGLLRAADRAASSALNEADVSDSDADAVTPAEAARG